MKKVALLLVVFLLIFGSFAISAEEVKVPFRAIKSICYSEIDMSKAEFALSEVGEKCVKKEWLEENKPEPKESELPFDFPIEKLVEEEPSLVDVVKVVDNPKELLRFMNGYFSIGAVKNRATGGTTAYSPERFLEIRLGDCKDWATFAAYVLNQNDYNAKKFSFSKHPMDDGHVIAIWKDEEGQYSYLTILGSKARIYWNVGSSIEDILASESDRLRIEDKILTYARHKPSTLDSLKAIGPKIAKATLKRVSHAKDLWGNELKLRSKSEYLHGRIVKIEKVSWKQYHIIFVVQMKLVFSDPSPSFVLIDLKSTPETNIIEHNVQTQESTSIELNKNLVGRKARVRCAEDVTKLFKIKRFTADQIIISE